MGRWGGRERDGGGVYMKGWCTGFLYVEGCFLWTVAQDRRSSILEVSSFVDLDRGRRFGHRLRRTYDLRTARKGKDTTLVTPSYLPLRAQP
jgi:hypothetical protein